MAGQRFVDAFNELFGDELPPANGANAGAYGRSAKQARIEGRCVRLGQTDIDPVAYYHRAVAKGRDGQLIVDEFWAPEIWTTKHYRQNYRSRQPQPAM